MKNPWETIGLDIYEQHMQLDSIRQLQTLNILMKQQLAAYPAETAVILGVAGGNGLEHINRAQYRAVYGVDINENYLCTVSERYPQLSDILYCLRLDLLTDAGRLPPAQLVIADLLIEYIGCAAFQKAVAQIAPEYVSCVIQINSDTTQWVSDSPYLHAFDDLNAVHHQISEKMLTAAMSEIGYSAALQTAEPLPNGKSLIRLDYRKQEKHSI